MGGAFGKLEGQVTALNAQLARTVALQNSMNGKGMANLAAAGQAAAANFRGAAQASGMFHAEQIRLNDATDEYVKRLNKQQMSFRQMMRQRSIASAAFKKQLAMEQSTLHTFPGGNRGGRQLAEMVTPANVTRDLATFGKQLAWTNAQLKSGANQLVNWGKNTQWAGRQLTVGLTMPVVAFGAAAGVMSYQLDKELTRIRKVYDTTFSQTSSNVEEQIKAQKELDQVTTDALKTAEFAAREYGSRAKETLEVQAELAATGQRGNALQEATKQVMRISTLGEIDRQDAMQATISMQSVFKQSTMELTESFNYMNAVENATSLQTIDFTQAIPIAAGVVKDFGGDIKELGILLTAMKERGIEATQGANAIKAAMQRLGRPSKQIQMEWKALTNTDITEIFEQSDNMIDLFSRIGDATENLSNKDRIKAFAGLFGTYQVRRLGALVDGMRDLENGTGQVTRAAQAAGMSFDELANIADKELGQQAESVSGRWDRALATMQIRLNDLGKPFVVAATGVLNVIAGILEKINDMPKAFKLALGGLIGLAAIAGPIIMLTGLLGTLTGMGLKGISTLISLGTSMKILDKESRAAELQTKLLNAGFVDQATATQNLTAQLNALTSAYASAAQAQRNAAATQGTPVFPGVPAGTPMPKKWGTQNGKPVDIVPQNANRGKGGILGSVTAVAPTAKVAENMEKTSKFAAGAAASMGVMAAGLLLTSATSNETANNIGKWMMLSSFIVPAAIQLVKLFSIANVTAAATAVKVKSIALWTAAVAKYQKLSALGARGMLASLVSAGPIVGGLTAVAVGLGYALYKSHQHIMEARKEATRMYNSVNGLTDAWAEKTGRVKKEWDGILVAQKRYVAATQQQKLVEQYASGDMKKRVDDWKTLGEGDQQRSLEEQFAELQVNYGMSVNEASANIQAFLTAANVPLAKQNAIIDSIVDNIGKLKQSNMGTWVQNQIDIFKNVDYGTKEWDKAGEDAAKAWAQAFNKNMRPEQVQPLLDQMTSLINTSWQGAFEDVSDSVPIRDVFREAGIESGAALREGVEAAGSVDEFVKKMYETGNIHAADMQTLREAINAALGDEKNFVNTAIDGNEGLNLVMGDGVKTLAEFQSHWLTMAQGDNLKEAQAQVQELAREMLLLPNAVASLIPGGGVDLSGAKTEMQRFTSVYYDMLKNNKKGAEEFDVAINTIAKMQGIKEGATTLETLSNILNGVKADAQGAAGGMRQLASAIHLSNQEMADVKRAGMEGVTNDIADIITDDFDQRMNASLDAQQNYWDDRKDRLQAQQDRESQALQDRQERENDAMDRRWEKRTNAAERYWDARIKKVDDAIKAEQKADEQRQRMFDAEIARIKKLNDMANRDIDFNVALNEGNLDEAAKIRNDAEAGQVEGVLERAKDSGTRRSEARVDRLEGRKDAIEKARDKFMDDLKQREKAERRSLEKRQRQEERALDRRQKANSDALDQMAENDMETQRRIWDSRKKALDDQMDLLRSGVARNEKELKAHMKKMGISYNEFGKILRKRGTTWGQFFGDSVSKHMRIAGKQLQTDKIWSQMGQKGAAGMLHGMGFKNWKQFTKFLNSGTLPDGFGKPYKPPAPKNTSYGAHVSNGKGGGGITRHEGGIIGQGGKDSRKGVARTTRGLHSSEVMVRAQKGEYVVNRDATQKYGGLLESINRGDVKEDKPRGVTRFGTGGEPVGIPGTVSGVMNSMLMKGMATAVRKVYERKQAEILAASLAGSLFSSAGGGAYGDVIFSGEQMKNAAIIANVGSKMGMSARDIQIGIMTAITESGLRNLNYGDRDSYGLFQQRPSMGWGSREQVTTPEYAARAFFGPLKAHKERNEESPWLAAQHIQRSAFSDGSNYKQYWDEAQAIFKRGLNRSKQGHYSPVAYGAGPGGWHRPVRSGHFSNSHDIGVPVGTPVYAVGDGRIVESRYITQGGSPQQAGSYPKIAPNGQPYRSYGETMVLEIGGTRIRYGHLQPGSRSGLGPVKGGTQIARSGATGNASGPHLHMDINGAEIASSWLASRGIGLRKGAMNINYDGVPAVLHRGEAVLTEDINRQFRQGVQNFSNPGQIVQEAVTKGIQTGDGGSGGSAGRRGEVRIASFNVHAYGHDNAKSIADLKRILPRTDAVALQENTRKAVSAWIQNQGFGLRQGPTGTAIAWRKSKFTASQFGNWDLNKKYKMPRGTSQRYIPYGLLRDRQTKKKFWLGSAHLIPGTGYFKGRVSDAQRNAILNEQYQRMAMLRNKLDNTAPVVFGGDYNDGRNGRIKGLRASGHKGIDKIYSGLKGTGKATKLSNKITNSDHAAVFQTYKLPQLSTGGYTVNSGLANLHPRELVVDAQRTKVLHEGIDRLATGGNNEYNVKVVLNGADVSADEVARKVTTGLQRLEARKPRQRRFTSSG
jgi:TP901 family phage tail tape measure protein